MQPEGRKSKRDRFEQGQREKEHKAAEVQDEREETSFEDSGMAIKVLGFTVVVFGTLYYIHKIMKEKVRKRKLKLEGKEEPLTEEEKMIAIGGDWVLKDLNGKNFGSGNLYGSYYLLYFGFSLCPDICPLSLMKMTKAAKKIQTSKEGQQYFTIKSVFVTVNPDYDTPEKLKDFGQNFDSKLIMLRDESNFSPYLQNMLKVFKVPIGLNEEERRAIYEYFYQKKKKESMFKRFKFWEIKETDPTEGLSNDHSKVFYLMSPENKFLGFYPLDIAENELVQHVIEDISIDINSKYIGTGKRAPTNIHYE